MKSVRFWIAGLAGGVVANLYDGIVQGVVFERMFYQHAPEVFTTSSNPTWFSLGDLGGALILAWMYDRVYDSFKPGAAGGVVFGLYAGLISSIPVYFFNHLMIRGYSLSLAVVTTGYMIVWNVLVAAVISVIYRRESSVEST